MIKENLTKLTNHIEQIKIKANINYHIDVMAVSKTRTVDEILAMIDQGILLYGENRILEAYSKFTSAPLVNKKIKLHIIGHLQRNKIKKAVEIADMIQSIDKISTLDFLEQACQTVKKKMDYLIEVNTSGESQKQGVLPDKYFEFLDQIINRSYQFCNLRGLMTVGPLTDNSHDVRNAFKLLNNLFSKTKNDIKKDDFDILSMGMSGDYPIAIEEGSNLIRIGTLLFGHRD